MQLTIANVLSETELAEVRDGLATLAFVDGRATAGWAAREVKHNRQAAPGPALDALRARVAERILAHPVFGLAVRPKRLTPLIFARYAGGESYGTHVDNALMGGVRTDVSFSLFLSPPESYGGGELVIETGAGEDAVKLAAGALVLYPATTLHRVAPVTAGERLVAVGWARSYIRSAERRELLFDLDTARRSLHDRHGASYEADLLAKCATNLLRQWAED